VMSRPDALVNAVHDAGEVTFTPLNHTGRAANPRTIGEVAGGAVGKSPEDLERTSAKSSVACVGTITG
jgi:2,4-dienoyl-CoA reductase-like NADH-dependent reductase (Old Yellow Enzyme family)